MLTLLEHRAISSGSHPRHGPSPPTLAPSSVHSRPGAHGRAVGLRASLGQHRVEGWGRKRHAVRVAMGEAAGLPLRGGRPDRGPVGSPRARLGHRRQKQTEPGSECVGPSRVWSCPEECQGSQLSQRGRRQGLAGAPSRDRPFQCPCLPSSRARNFPSAGPPRPTCLFVTQLPGVWSPGFAHRSSPALASNFCFHLCFSSLPDFCYFFYPMCQIALVLGCILPPRHFKSKKRDAPYCLWCVTVM